MSFIYLLSVQHLYYLYIVMFSRIGPELNIFMSGCFRVMLKTDTVLRGGCKIPGCTPQQHTMQKVQSAELYLYTGRFCYGVGVDVCVHQYLNIVCSINGVFVLYILQLIYHKCYLYHPERVIPNYTIRASYSLSNTFRIFTLSFLDKSSTSESVEELLSSLQTEQVFSVR